MNYLTQSYGQRQAEIEAARVAFLMRGGKVEVLETFKFEPYPKRIEPELSPVEIERRQLAARIIELKPKMFKSEIAKELGISLDRIYQLCKLYRITLRSGSGRNPSSSWMSRPAQKELAERIKALAEVGLTQEQATKQVGIRPSKMARLMAAFDITFPGPKN